MRRFHGAAARTFAVTADACRASLSGAASARSITGRCGVDLEQFSPQAPPHPGMVDLPRPILLNVGRVAVEKNLEAFLSPTSLERRSSSATARRWPSCSERFPRLCSSAPCMARELASAYAAADLFVFPSRTDTFGLVNIEALASGLPVAAYPVPGPLDIIGLEGRGVMHGREGHIGALADNLGEAIRKALDRGSARLRARSRPLRMGPLHGSLPRRIGAASEGLGGPLGCRRLAFFNDLKLHVPGISVAVWRPSRTYNNFTRTKATTVSGAARKIPIGPNRTPTPIRENSSSAGGMCTA